MVEYDIHPDIPDIHRSVLSKTPVLSKNTSPIVWMKGGTEEVRSGPQWSRVVGGGREALESR